jgi:N-ethylmaleimide reductase
MSESTTLIAPATAAQKTPVEPLFEPVRLGRYDLRHRMVMAPLTRSRARQPGNVPSALNACYYAQRASAPLIVTEATQVSQQGQGYAWTPGSHSREQVEGWRLVTDAVQLGLARLERQALRRLIASLIFPRVEFCFASHRNSKRR